MSAVDCDVAVVGGGLVGASAALAMSRAGLSTVMIEPVPVAPAEPAPDERCIGLNAASVVILKDLGVWSHIEGEAAPIRSTLVNEAGRLGSARFSAADAGLEALGYNTPLRAVHAALLDALKATDAELRHGAAVAAMQAEDDAASLQLDDGSSLRARLVVACDGTDSPLRAAAGIPTEAFDYGQTALVSTVDVQRDHGGCAWERFLPGGPLAVLPRGERRCTLVWTQAHGDTTVTATLKDEAFCAAVQKAFGSRLGSFSNPGRRMRWPLRRVVATRITAPRLLLAGNAAQTLHPVAAQGFNLGLRDCAAAAAVAASASDPGGESALSRYAELRAEDREATIAFTDRLVRIFSNRWPGLAGLRHLGLTGLGVLPAAHREVMLQNLGLPALARLRAAS
ncbi:FAD-dependent monooxygenase [Algiphilus aromaticivorans]|jgi:2-octaprenyl-6-methoxyphenol hydroxylase|uniref:FAD-dependent monooxygenase n=1 Tax=Algiphilus aromaticivorans TaxID=382454 RepID=UPI0005C14DB3|nr:FAD-dependent monooxygenase [Algiphilus aromaticivorans]